MRRVKLKVAKEHKKHRLFHFQPSSWAVEQGLLIDGVVQVDHRGEFPVTLLNNGVDTISLQKGEEVGTFEPIDELVSPAEWVAERLDRLKNSSSDFPEKVSPPRPPSCRL